MKWQKKNKKWGIYKMSVEKSTPTKDGKCWVFRCRYKNILGETKSYRSGRFKTKKEAQEAEE